MKKVFVWLIVLFSILFVGLGCAFVVIIYPSFSETTHGNLPLTDGLFSNPFESYEKGKQEGLSAKDTQISLERDIKESGRLNVLLVHANVTNFHSVGEKDWLGEKYAALYLYRVTYTFSVDLSKANIEVDDRGLVSVVLPQVEYEIGKNYNESEKIAEYQNLFYNNGTTKDGIEAYLNSEKELEKEAEEYIRDNSEIFDNAKESAIEQVRELIQGMLIASNTNVEISFEENK